MHDNDGFRLIDESTAAGALLALAAACVLVLHLERATPAPSQPAPSCSATVAQYGPGERWVSQPRQPSCVAVYHDAPYNFLTHPIPEGK